MTLIYDFFFPGDSRTTGSSGKRKALLKGQNTQKGHEASPVGTYSRVAKQHTAARLAQSTIRAFFAASVSMLRTTQGTWSMSAYLPETVAAVTVATLKRGGYP